MSVYMFVNIYTSSIIIDKLNDTKKKTNIKLNFPFNKLLKSFLLFYLQCECYLQFRNVQLFRQLLLIIDAMHL